MRLLQGDSALRGARVSFSRIKFGDELFEHGRTWSNMVEHDPLEDMQPKTVTAVLMRDNFLWIGRMQQDVAAIIIVLKFINCDAGVPCRNGKMRLHACARDLQIAFEKL